MPAVRVRVILVVTVLLGAAIVQGGLVTYLGRHDTGIEILGHSYPLHYTDYPFRIYATDPFSTDGRTWTLQYDVTMAGRKGGFLVYVRHPGDDISQAQAILATPVPAQGIAPVPLVGTEAHPIYLDIRASADVGFWSLSGT
jgi:hypothetical protein